MQRKGETSTSTLKRAPLIFYRYVRTTVEQLAVGVGDSTVCALLSALLILFPGGGSVLVLAPPPCACSVVNVARSVVYALGGLDSPHIFSTSLAMSNVPLYSRRFDVKLDVAEPEVDDRIMIESPLNKQASVAFRLCNNTAA